MLIPGSFNPLGPSSACSRPAANAAIVAVSASRTHAVVNMFLCARIWTGMGACEVLALVSGNWGC
eukprot:662127-Pleurochrysis_carterae.AAC.1